MTSLYSSSKPALGAPPAFIAALERTISKRTFLFSTSNGHDRFEDTSNDRNEYVRNLSCYLPPSTPKLTKAGTVAVHQPHVIKMSLKWWRAQCGFRDLPMNGTIAVLQERLRDYGDKGMGEKISRIRDGMKEDYCRMNDEKLKELWAESDDSKKAVLWPEKLLYDIFHAKPGTKADTAVVIVEDWAEGMEKAAKAMNVAYETRRLPLEQYPDGKYVSGIRQVVLGTNVQAVKAKSAELNQERDRANKREQVARLEREREKAEELRASFSKATKQGKNGKGMWEVSGKWVVSCPSIEREWGSGEPGCTLTIELNEEEGRATQMWARFDFIVITGVMRFVSPEASTWLVQENLLPTYEEEDEDEDDEEDEGEPDDDSDGESAQFLFPSSLLPSSKNKKFQFRWRGEETGEGEIQLRSDQKLCSLEFASPNALKGIFKGGFTGDVEFKAYKEDMDKGAGQKRKRYYPLSIDDAWNARNEAAHERARIGRWR